MQNSFVVVSVLIAPMPDNLPLILLILICSIILNPCAPVGARLVGYSPFIVTISNLPFFRAESIKSAVSDE
jgi:hypothetical protein